LPYILPGIADQDYFLDKYFDYVIFKIKLKKKKPRIPVSITKEERG